MNHSDVEIFLAMQRIGNYVVNNAWKTSSSDYEYEYGLAKSKESADDISIMAQIEDDLVWGNSTHRVKADTFIKRTGDSIEVHYAGEEINLIEVLWSLESFADVLYSTDPVTMEDAEFLHYYKFLKRQEPYFKASHNSIDFDDLHPKIQEHCSDRFYDKQYSDAILAAYKVVLNEVKHITGIHNLDGKPLVEKAFSLNAPLIKLNDLVTQSDKDEQQGFMMLFSGAAVGIRNPKAHDLVVQSDKYKTLRYLTFASLLLERLDERTYPAV